ncbi:MAG: KilA-N domain-containing protein [Treponema sp.]|nr:KilA-N domain-containing protein [Treponema sp.]
MIIKKSFKTKNPDILSGTYVHAVAFIIVHFAPWLRKTFAVVVTKLYSMITN